MEEKLWTKLDSILKSRDITLPTKIHLVKAMVFPVVMYACESWTIKTAECQRIDAFERWCWRRLLRVPWTARRSNQSILQEISPEYPLEGLMLKLKLQILATRYEELTHWGRSWCWEGLKAEEKKTAEDEMVGWNRRLDGHEFDQSPGVGDGQGGLACSSAWGRKESDKTAFQGSPWIYLDWCKCNCGFRCAFYIIITRFKHILITRNRNHYNQYIFDTEK